MHRTPVLVTLALILSVAAGTALAGSTPNPSVGGVEAELACSPSSEGSLSSLDGTVSGLDGTVCRELAQSIFKLDTSAAAAQLSLAELSEAQDSMKAQLDSLNQFDELSLRLQRLMERRQQLISTLSNILKKISDTQAGIVQNLK